MKFLLILFVICVPLNANSWGFFAHQKINKLAVFTLPPEMISFYKRNIVFITENAVNPDKRRYAVKEEAARHYIDLDVYGDSAAYKLPRSWNEAVRKFSEDTLQAYGIVPWHIVHMKHQLTDAFQQRDPKRILRLSADIAHYIGDANVPLHTTRNYNGQLTGQKGIHGFWESRLPELYSDEYDFFVGRAQYLQSPQQSSWDAVFRAHNAVDSVLLFESELNASYPEDKKYSFEERGGVVVKVYSKEYSKAYHMMLHGQVEKQMQASVKMVGDFWFTCWVDAGQPELNSLVVNFSEQEIKEMKIPSVHPEGDCNH
jgi:hypothetical protein